MVFKSRRQSRLTVATMFLFRGEKNVSADGFFGVGTQRDTGLGNMGNTHCKVGTMPLGLF
jgi:hypothetical protein